MGMTRGAGWKLLRERRAEVLAVAERYQATNVRAFGSVAVGTETAFSDIDLLVDLPVAMSPGEQLLAVGGLAVELTELLGRRVDVATIQLLRPAVRDVAAEQAIAI
jgi:predicted nucleotidyltransferase